MTGPVVGLFETWKCETRCVQLEPDDLLVIFTDGVTDATAPDGEEFGEQRLVEVIAEHHDLPARALLQEIVDDVKRYGGPGAVRRPDTDRRQSRVTRWRGQRDTDL